MKFNQLENVGFLGRDGAAEHSFVLVNYAETQNDSPLTKRVSVEALGQAIANQLGIVMNDANDGPFYYTVEGELASSYTPVELALGGGSGEGGMDISAIAEGIEAQDINQDPVYCKWLFAAPSIGFCTINDSGVVEQYDYSEGWIDPSEQISYKWMVYDTANNKIGYISNQNIFTEVSQ